MAISDAVLTRWFEEHRTFLWGVCYRVTGSAADADDAVQETFIRALKHAPEELEEPRRWLVTVAANASRDFLRRRKRRSYIGPWLPSPIETADEGPLPSYEPAADGGRTLEGRYDLMESVSLAFLRALEALTPTQRAVLLLCDVFDYSAGEVAAALDLSEGNARIIHHRARHAMAAYDAHRTPPTAANRARTSLALERFLNLLGNADVPGIERMLAADIRAVTDGGGQFTASPYPIVGAANVAQFFVRLAASRPAGVRIRVIDLNGFPAALFEFDTAMGRRPPRLVLAADVDTDGCIAGLWVVANPRKLTAVRNGNPS
ncbi:MAG TPA: sigma-70 family RNA polymerase sigma factor [Vicinamibacterales bacterium]|nr:sigma-70 family RNA polymerase sigma factor [Vicinamibacterales bacterium]